MNQQLKAIETVYRGYRFRSRLEARWAVFFDTLGVPWEYEKEGYDLGPAGWYLPDFWLPRLKMWAEVKAEAFTPAERDKAQALADASRFPVLKLIGIPDYIAYWTIDPRPPSGYRCGERCEIALPVEQRTGDLQCLACYQNATDKFETDYILDDQYCHSENRWFCSPGLKEGEPASDTYWVSDLTRAAYAAARGARFEHGEAPN